MNLLEDAWIPVRADGGNGGFRLLTYRQLLCEPGSWQVSLPRDDLELACLQLLVCMTQVMFLPADDATLRKRLDVPLPSEDFAAGISPCRDWFDLDHPTQPFMQSRGVKTAEYTPIQKLLVGLPEGNNHAFFNDAGEVRKLSGPIAAIALFNQASNAQSIGGGFKGNLRGGSNPYLAPVNTLVAGDNLRETVWRNVLTLPRVQDRLPGWTPDFGRDQPTWIKPIKEKEVIRWNEIGLFRGLFWQPLLVELVRSEDLASCDVLGGEEGSFYSGFRKAKFKFSVEGIWTHPHGAMIWNRKKNEHRFVSFSAASPAWTLLSEFVVPRDVDGLAANEGCMPAGPVVQAMEVFPDEPVHLIVGGYCTRQASVVERRHELMSLAKGWDNDKTRLKQLVDFGTRARQVLYKSIALSVRGDKKNGIKGIASPIHDSADKHFYARTESLIHEIFSNALTFREWKGAKAAFTDQLAGHCRAIFQELTDPYAMKPELIPAIAWARHSLDFDLAKLKEGT